MSDKLTCVAASKLLGLLASLVFVAAAGSACTVARADSILLNGGLENGTYFFDGVGNPVPNNWVASFNWAGPDTDNLLVTAALPAPSHCK